MKKMIIFIVLVVFGQVFAEDSKNWDIKTDFPESMPQSGDWECGFYARQVPASSSLQAGKHYKFDAVDDNKFAIYSSQAKNPVGCYWSGKYAPGMFIRRAKGRGGYAIRPITMDGCTAMNPWFDEGADGVKGTADDTCLDTYLIWTAPVDGRYFVDIGVYPTGDKKVATQGSFYFNNVVQDGFDRVRTDRPITYAKIKSLSAGDTVEIRLQGTQNYTDKEGRDGKNYTPFYAKVTKAKTPGPNDIYANKNYSAEARAKNLVENMTLDEKLSYVGGVSGFFLRAVPRLGLPTFGMADGPCGVRCIWYSGDTTQYPAQIALGASWNKTLAREAGRTYANDAKARGVHILLAPGTNVVRAPQCGRNFEYLSEDPYLIGHTAANFIDSLQDTGVVATMKTYLGNNEEYDRHNVNSTIDERTLNEIYMASFRTVIKETDLHSVMTTYALVNGEYTANNKPLLTDLLKGQLGFEGYVVSDWLGTHACKESFNAGLDLEMPKAHHMKPEALKKLLDSGEISMDLLEEKIYRILTPMFKMGFYDHEHQDMTIPRSDPRSAAVALKIAQEGMVLLKNDDSFLPLSKEDKLKIIVLGETADTVPDGKGSSRVSAAYKISLLEGLNKVAGKNAEIIFDDCDQEAADKKDHSRKLTFDSQAVKSADVVIISVRTLDGEGGDRSYGLLEKDVRLIREVSQISKKVIVIFYSGGNVAIPEWDSSSVKSIIAGWFPGQEGGKALAQIIFGDVNPSAKLPVSFEKKWEDSPVYNSYYAYEDHSNKRTTLNEMRAIKFDHGEIGDLEYSEGIYLGYRHFDRSDTKPLYPFGYGLSYTTFKYSNMKLSEKKIKAGQKVTVSVDITNTGDRYGAEIVQLYVGDDKCSVDRPVKELKGYEKVFLYPGQTKTVDIELDDSAFEFYSVKKHDWKIESGSFTIYLAASSADIRHQMKLYVKR
ncbi:MAG: beta-glucosidase family protein [Planctomycetota bacterium]|jgi:beta-glucosidase